MKTRSDFLLCILAIVLFSSTYALADSFSQKQDKLNTVIGVLKSKRFDGSGRGSAVTNINDNGVKKTSVFDFRFKDGQRRSDIFDKTDGVKGARISGWSVNKDNSICFNGRYATLQNRGFKMFNDRIGLDFDPATFNKIRKVSVDKVLENIAKEAADIDIGIDEDGIMHIDAKFAFEDREKKAELTIDLDTKKDYNLVSWSHVMENVNGRGSKSECSYKARWENSGGVWYVSGCDYQENSTKVINKGKVIEPKQESYKLSMAVSDFAGGAEIADDEFELSGFDLPFNTPINDKIQGIVYRYGTGLSGTERLEGPLFEAAFFEDYVAKTDTEKNDSNGTGNMESEIDDLNKSGTDGDIGIRLAQKQTVTGKLNILWYFLSAAGFILLVAAVIVKKLRRGGRI